MPIPNFDHNEVLPPHLGDPRRPDELTPFPTTSEEVCQRFATSPERRTILDGWLNFRSELSNIGITNGFQWLDGSFLENVEATQGRAPNDLDVVTFYYPPAGVTAAALLPVLQRELPEFFDRPASKARFHLDHFGIHLGTSGIGLVDNTRYWAGLFSHRRDGVWKGMLRVELNTAAHDITAAAVLTAAP
ncbi:MAG TPA: hypothetical protein VGH90_10915 [Chthoniobacteraceae bacterium]|jgi:hypothetical protein